MPPAFPEPAPHLPRSTIEMHLRYEDVAEDGRVMVGTIPVGIGPAIWGAQLARGPIAHKLVPSGVLALLTRLEIEGGGGPVSVGKTVTVVGSHQLAHARDAAGNVERLYLNHFITMTAPRARTHGPAPEGAGEPIVIGRCFVENVFTRPFAAPGERKVLRFDVEGLPAVPPDVHVAVKPETTLALPEGAKLLDAEPAADEATTVFGLAHTDSNRHVNSLVYPRLFEEAALRRLSRLGVSTSALLARRVTCAYRKPCFAGERYRILLAAFDSPGGPGAVGAFVPDDDRAARPHVFCRVTFG